MSGEATSVSAAAPAKAILFGEHAVNRGQSALAVSVGIHARCHLNSRGARPAYSFAGSGRAEQTTRDAILELGRTIDGYRERADYAAIQALAARDFWAPAKYVLAAAGDALPASLDAHFDSAIPPSAGLGSGGAIFVSLAAALARLIGMEVAGRDAMEVAGWAQRGDIVAHGGVASGLDTQTSWLGGVIRYTVVRGGEPLHCAHSPHLVVGNTGVYAATSEVNGRVRTWLADRPARMHYFQEIGLLAHLAEEPLGAGDWLRLGHLLNLNQLLLERIGVSCPELERLIDAALGAGALGAKLSGSGGGGIMIALVTPETASVVAQAITDAGGTALVAPTAVPGVTLEGD